MNKDKRECEGCHQEFNWWDLIWNGAGVCVSCYHIPTPTEIDKKKIKNFQSGLKNTLTGGKDEKRM